jgi:hypothetical protein
VTSLREGCVPMTGKAAKLASWGGFGTFKGLQNMPHKVLAAQTSRKNNILAEIDPPSGECRVRRVSRVPDRLRDAGPSGARPGAVGPSRDLRYCFPPEPENLAEGA